MRIVPGVPAVLVVVLLAGGCTSAPTPAVVPTAIVGSSSPVGVAPSTDPAPPPPPPSPAAYVPAQDEPVPADPAALAQALEMVTEALASSIDAWRQEGDPSGGDPPEAVVLQALYEQRIYRKLLKHPDLADSTLDRLPVGLRGEAASIVAAGAELYDLIVPISPSVDFPTGPPQAAGVLLGWFREAEQRFGVDWQLVAAVMYVESKFGRVRSSSTAGAQGPMQFLPGTWAAYGMGGDIHDPHDAILGAANYLNRSGAPEDESKALFAYNHASAYVDAVLRYADLMRADIRRYFVFYNWQVFVLTTAGDRRLTGPGR